MRPILSGGQEQAEDVFVQWNAEGAKLQKSAHVASSEDERERAARANVRAVITQDGWKLCLSDGDKSQLYNLAADPGETRNLFYLGADRQVIGRLTKQIQSWQADVKDPIRLT